LANCASLQLVDNEILTIITENTSLIFDHIGKPTSKQEPRR
jgi:hypothetical protein